MRMGLPLRELGPTGADCAGSHRPVTAQSQHRRAAWGSGQTDTHKCRHTHRHMYAQTHTHRHARRQTCEDTQTHTHRHLHTRVSPWDTHKQHRGTHASAQRDRPHPSVMSGAAGGDQTTRSEVFGGQSWEHRGAAREAGERSGCPGNEPTSTPDQPPHRAVAVLGLRRPWEPPVGSNLLPLPPPPVGALRRPGDSQASPSTHCPLSPCTV